MRAMVLLVCSAPLVAAALLLGASAGAGETADADRGTGSVLLSRDGSTYVASLDGRVFDADTEWEPGAFRQSRVWVRNDADDARDVTLDLVGTTGSTALTSDDVQVSARVGDGLFEDLAVGDPLRVMTERLDADQRVPVTLRVTLAPEADADAVTPADLGLAAAAATPAPPVVLRTGASTWWLVPMGVLAVSGGALALSRRRAAVEAFWMPGL